MQQFHNRTRQSASIPRKLLRNRQPHLIPLYYIMLTSFLAKEGIVNSGSYAFADHIYQAAPKGTHLIGRPLDKLLLSLPSARSMRGRYLHAKAAIHETAGQADDGEVHILAMPSGFAREFFEAADELRAVRSAVYERIHWHCLDLDPTLLQILQDRARDAGHKRFNFYQTDVFRANQQLRPRKYHLIVSTGLTEFLDDDQTAAFYRVAKRHLAPGGRLYTTGLLRHRLSDYLLRNMAELHTHYRSPADLERLLQAGGFTTIHTRQEQLLSIGLASA